MKIYYQFNVNPFCTGCLDAMNVERPDGDRDEDGNIRSYAYCRNEKCHQYKWRFIIPPLSTEAVPVDNEAGIGEFHKLIVYENHPQNPKVRDAKESQ